MPANVEAQDLKIKRKKRANEYKFVFNTQYQKGKLKKEEVKEKFPLVLCSQEKTQTWVKKKLERNDFVRTRPLKV